ncbi:unnamed protein product [Ambrosiozyma monospora]|uniref:Unnamed protein product n=1 Tax=Ambrosiozyma monospora TaxID=43982 RepID=A0ACB5T3M4_AMBMO|nr:unnamed protein product [Ambrosiozyma monospora]
MLHGQDHACIVSLNRILVMSLVKMSVDWVLPYEKIEHIILERTGIMIKEKNSYGPERFIPISDAAEKRFLYSKISVAVSEYTKRSFIAL